MHHLLGVADTALAAGGPEFPSVATPAEYFLGTVKVVRRVARSFATTTGGPVHVVDLPQTNIIAAIGILISSICIATTLSLHDTLTGRLLPATVLGAPGRYTLRILRGTTRA